MKKSALFLFLLLLIGLKSSAQSLSASGSDLGPVPIDFSTIDFSNTYNSSTRDFAVQASVKYQFSSDPQIVFIHVDIVGYDSSDQIDPNFYTYYASLSYPDSGVLPANKTYDSHTDGDNPGYISVPTTTAKIVYTFSVVTTTNSNSGYSHYEYTVYPY